MPRLDGRRPVPSLLEVAGTHAGPLANDPTPTYLCPRRPVLAFVLQPTGPCLVRDRPRPSPADGEVRVRVLRAGICNTDLELARGYMGFEGVLGHEFVGRALGGALAGERVVAGINLGCRRCRWCRGGLVRHCPERRVLGILGADGAMAEEVVVPEANLLAVPEKVGDDEAVFAEPLAAACEILDQLDALSRRGVSPAPGAGALVLGAGKLGPLIAQVLAAAGFAVELVGRHLDGLDWLRARGVELRTQPPRTKRALVVEATGTAEGLQQAIALTEPRGTLVLKTTVAVRHDVDLAPVVVDEITIVGSRCGRMESALERLAAGEIGTSGLVDSCHDLEDAQRAFARAAAPGVRKVILKAPE